jgi:uncharacterized protein YbjT (DUF2867 family)
VTNARTTEQAPATEFFQAVAGNLQRAAGDERVAHIVTLSIVGIDKIGSGYYAAKLEHERAAARGPVPSTGLRGRRSTNFLRM